jgi:hypothetical protein
MEEWLDRVRDIVEQLKDQRAHVAEGTRVLEAVISYCSELARHLPAGKLRDVAVQFRDRAIAMYSISKDNAASVTELLEGLIAQLEPHIALRSA